MPSEATETVPVTEQEMQQPQVETGSYDLLSAYTFWLFCIENWGPGAQSTNVVTQFTAHVGRTLF